MNTVLGKDENKIKEASFTANLLLFWLKANYLLTNKRLTGDTPNTLLGLIPLGKAEMSQPLKTIASVTSSTKFTIGRLLLGIILLFIGIALLEGSVIIGLLLFFLGVVNILNCYTATFIVTNNGGQRTGYEISILEQSKVVEFTNEVNTVIVDL